MNKPPSTHLRKPAEGKVLPRWKTPQGWAILQVHGPSCVPGYDYEAVCQGMSPDMISREIDLNWNASGEKRVYPEFQRRIHLATEPIEFNPDLPLHCGWDMPGCPAFAVTQVNEWGQWCLLSSVSPKESKSISPYEFGEMVANHLFRKYAEPHGLELGDLDMVHIGDPAGYSLPPRAGETPKEVRSCFDIIYRGVKVYLGKDEDGEPEYEELPGWGWRIEPGAVGHKERQQAVSSRLRRLIGEGIPALLVNAEPDGRIFLELFEGGYHYPEKHDGRYGDEPQKNWHSHSANATEYIASRLDAVPPRKDDDWTPKREPWRSQASRNR